MILRFAAENHRSIAKRQEISFVASGLADSETGLIHTSVVPNEKLLPAIVIYGANASGKSNFLSALNFMCSAVAYSHKRGGPEDKVPRRPFVLDTEWSSKPSKFDTDFAIEGTRYHYGFEVTDTEFVSEWLYAFPNGRKQSLFERQDGRFVFSRHLKGRNKVIGDLTRKNSLFLSAAAQNDHAQLTEVARFFEDLGEARFSYGFDVDIEATRAEFDRRAVELLERIGTGIVEFEKRTAPLTERERVVRRQVFEFLKSIAPSSELKDDHEEAKTQLRLGHRNAAGNITFLPVEDESQGTKRLLRFLGPIFSALDRGKPIIIDELGLSLHTQACEVLLGLFSVPSVNNAGAQLLATTHDTNLLRSGFLRRDQIWFAEKADDGSTSIYPLTDIATRKGDNIEKGYLQGRFGAIPFAGSITELLDRS